MVFYPAIASKAVASKAVASKVASKAIASKVEVFKMSEGPHLPGERPALGRPPACVGRCRRRRWPRRRRRLRGRARNHENARATTGEGVRRSGWLYCVWLWLLSNGDTAPAGAAELSGRRPSAGFQRAPRPVGKQKVAGDSWLTAAIPVENHYCSCKLTAVS